MADRAAKCSCLQRRWPRCSGWHSRWPESHDEQTALESDYAAEPEDALGCARQVPYGLSLVSRHRPPPLTVNRRWIVADHGKLWTSSGVSAGTDAMLALIDHMYGKNEQGVLYGDLIKEGMEWNRVYDSTADPFAVSNGAEDVEALA